MSNNSTPNYDHNSINNLIIRSPGLRTTKEYLAKLNDGTNIVEFRPAYAGYDNNNGYRIFLTGYADYILKLEQSYEGFAVVALQRNINALRSRPRPQEAGYRNPGSIDTWVVEGDKHHIYYKISNGQILIFNITVKNATWTARAKNETAGLYKVTIGPNGDWKRQRVTRITTEYAAINGILNNLHKATWLLAEHLRMQYKKEIKEFTLFHNPSRGAKKDAGETLADHSGKTTAITKTFAKLLVDTQDNGHSVKWVAHSQGGLIFCQAVVWLNNGKKDYPPESNAEENYFPTLKAKVLDKHSVAFRGAPVNNSNTRRHMKASKIEINGMHSHPNDPVAKILGFNTLNPVALLKAFANLSDTIGGTAYNSPHTFSPDKETLKKWKKLYPKHDKPDNIEISTRSGFPDGKSKHKIYSYIPNRTTT